jgi:N6-L-threonylcarbamoyladenine synthase
MRGSLAAGIDTAKGLAVAWQVPILGVNHMQAHALTPRLVSALEGTAEGKNPEFPFLTLLVSGGHTMLVHSCALCDHRILANTTDIAIGDVIDKCARDILPPEIMEDGKDVMYGPLLERFAFPNGSEDYNYTAPGTREEDLEVRSTGYDWTMRPILSQVKGGKKVNALEYSFSGVGSAVKRLMTANPTMGIEERRVLAREVMRTCFEHLAKRILIALRSPEIQANKTLVASGGVASNQYLKHILRATLEKRGFANMDIVFPPPNFCTDNAAMIAWTGMEMWEEGWRSGMECLALRKWAISPDADDGGILGVGGWTKVS